MLRRIVVVSWATTATARPWMMMMMTTTTTPTKAKAGITARMTKTTKKMTTTTTTMMTKKKQRWTSMPPPRNYHDDDVAIAAHRCREREILQGFCVFCVLVFVFVWLFEQLFWLACKFFNIHLTLGKLYMGGKLSGRRIRICNFYGGTCRIY